MTDSNMNTISIHMLSDPKENTFYVDCSNIKKHFKIKNLDIHNHYQYTHGM